MQGVPANTASATVTVRNFSWSPVRVFASRTEERIPLGEVPVFGTQILTIQRGLILPVTVQFEVEPFGHGQGAIRTESVALVPGDRYALTIERSAGQYQLVRLP